MAEAKNIKLLEELQKLISKDETIAFTGRRPKDLCGYATEKYTSFVSWFSDFLYLEFYTKRGIRTWITGGAQGIDQLAFWAVEQMRKRYKLKDIKNTVFAVSGQSIKWAQTGAFSQKEYNMMLGRADILCYVSGGSIKALFERNHFMCDWSGTVLGVYPDDTWTSNKGGTSECLRYATKGTPEEKQVFRLSYSFDDSRNLVPGQMIDCWTEKEPPMFV